MSDPLVSIAMPVFNGGAMLESALSDLCSQTWPNLEIVVSDNASIDGTRALLARWSASDPRIRVQRTPSTVEMRHNFMNALEAASGKYAMWAAHDDRWEPDYIEGLVGLLEQDERALLAAGIPHVLGDDGATVRTYPRVSELAGGDRVSRMERFILQPEDAGKANLIYGVFRRAEVKALDLRRFLDVDARRLDYHVVLAMLSRGSVAIASDVRHLKTVLPDSASGVRRATSALAATRRSWQWIDAYAGVVDATVEDPVERTRLHAAVRRRKRNLPLARLRRLTER